MTIVEDARSSAEWIARALCSSGYNADFSMESLKEIDRFFDEQTEAGHPKRGGLLGEQLGVRIFSIGSYIGEVIRRAAGGDWNGDDSDPEAEINIELRLPNEVVIWPIQRAMKRLRKGRRGRDLPVCVYHRERVNPPSEPIICA